MSIKKAIFFTEGIEGSGARGGAMVKALRHKP
jgi:hypothetical protein